MPRRSRTLLKAKMLRTSSSTTSTLRPTSASSLRCKRSSIRCFSGGRLLTTRCRNSAVSSSNRSGDSTPFTTTLRASACSRESSSGDNSLPVNTTTGKSLSDSESRRLLQNLKSRHVGQRRSSTTQSNALLGDCFQSFGATGDRCHVDVIMSQQFSNAELLRRVVLDY